VVIDTGGHILTIGYLILEAESIEVVRPDGESMAASCVVYDHATGFGVVKAGQPRGLVAIEVGRSAELNVGDQILLVGYGGAGSIRPASLIARKKFTGYWEYLFDEALYSAPPHPEFAGVPMRSISVDQTMLRPYRHSVFSVTASATSFSGIALIWAMARRAVSTLAGSLRS